MEKTDVSIVLHLNIKPFLYGLSKSLVELDIEKTAGMKKIFGTCAKTGTC